EAAARTADVSRARAGEIRATLRRDVAQAWWDAYLLERTIAITSRNLELVVDLERVVREKYRTGEAGRLDLGRAHIELGRVEDRVRGLRDRVPAARARLASLLSLPDGESLPLPVDPGSVPSAPSSDRVAARVGPAAPRLATADARVEEAGARRALAGRASWPDLMLGVEWIRTGDARAANVAGSGDDPWVVSVTADLPIFRGKFRGAVEEAEAREAATRSERRRTEDELRAAAESARVDWADADRRIALYRDGLVPEAADSREAAFAAYRAGEATFLDLVDAERLLLELSIEEERARADRGRAAAALEFVTGRDWTEEGIR
ncbi:MAG: TolC family protein, partial [Gemmatimonadetes bacterium]|nr:TolC family protein [Gemmatimonadota bacterium]